MFTQRSTACVRLYVCIDSFELDEILALCKQMARVWENARSVPVTQAQVASMHSCLDKMLIRWEVERIPFAGPRSQVYMSTQTLVGCARFVVSIPQEVLVLILGVNSPLGARKVFMQTTEAVTKRMCWSMGHVRPA